MHEARRTQISKFLSLVLRHKPEEIGITLDTGGWVPVEGLLEGLRQHGLSLTREELAEVVATNAKQRFAFSPDGTRIRASQGHSLAVELGYTAEEPPELLYHGTGETSLASIRAQGLVKQARHHVHLSATPETARQVGMRHGVPAVLTVRAGAMWRDGYVFYRSANQVWLTERVPAAYLEFPDDDPPHTKR